MTKVAKIHRRGNSQLESQQGVTQTASKNNHRLLRFCVRFSLEGQKPRTKTCFFPGSMAAAEDFSAPTQQQ